MVKVSKIKDAIVLLRKWANGGYSASLISINLTSQTECGDADALKETMLSITNYPENFTLVINTLTMNMAYRGSYFNEEDCCSLARVLAQHPSLPLGFHLGIDSKHLKVKYFSDALASNSSLPESLTLHFGKYCIFSESSEDNIFELCRMLSTNQCLPPAFNLSVSGSVSGESIGCLSEAIKNNLHLPVGFSLYITVKKACGVVTRDPIAHKNVKALADIVAGREASQFHIVVDPESEYGSYFDDYNGRL